jgi:hypothetical protein
VSHLNEAIKLVQRALMLTPDDDPEHTYTLCQLALSFWSRYKQTGAVDDFKEATTLYSRAAKSEIGNPGFRFAASRGWASLLASQDSASALSAYERAMEIVPEMVWIGDLLNARHSRVVGIDRLPSEAAAVAIAAGDLRRGLEWLEEGRSVVWNQLLSLQSSVDGLRPIDPQLSSEFEQVSRDLYCVGTQEHVPDRFDRYRISLEDEARQRRKLVEKRNKLIGVIRCLPGFEDFLRPVKFATLRRAAEFGPVVVINIHRERCDALVLRQDNEDLQHVALPNLTLKRVESLRESLKAYLSSLSHARGESTRAGYFFRDFSDEGGKKLLSGIRLDLWERVVHPILQAMGLSVSIIVFRVHDT